MRLLPLLVVFNLMATSCSKYLFSSAVCGPQSPDQYPYAVLPAEAYGCFEMITSLPSHVVSPDYALLVTSTVEQEYVFIEQQGDGLNISSSKKIKSKQAELPYQEVCAVPTDYDSDDPIYLNQVSRDGLYSFQFLTINRRQIVIQDFELNLSHLAESGLEFTNLLDFERTGRVRLQPLYAINNKGFTMQQLFKKVTPRPNSLSMTLNRVPDKHCQSIKSHGYFNHLKVN